MFLLKGREEWIFSPAILVYYQFNVMGLVNVYQKYYKKNKKKSAIFSAQNTIICPIGNVNKDGEKSPFPPLFFPFKWF